MSTNLSNRDNYTICNVTNVTIKVGLQEVPSSYIQMYLIFTHQAHVYARVTHCKVSRKIKLLVFDHALFKFLHTVWKHQHLKWRCTRVYSALQYRLGLPDLGKLDHVLKYWGCTTLWTSYKQLTVLIDNGSTYTHLSILLSKSFYIRCTLQTYTMCCFHI